MRHTVSMPIAISVAGSQSTAIVEIHYLIGDAEEGREPRIDVVAAKVIDADGAHAAPWIAGLVRADDRMRAALIDNAIGPVSQAA